MHTVDVPNDPALRPRRVRRTARLLVIDESDHVLLFRDSDLGLDPVPHWWITPGGGLDPGESDVEAAVRELREETGLRVGVGDVIGPVASRPVIHGYSDQIVEQVEVFFVVTTTRFVPDPAEQTAEELVCFVDHGWFGRGDLVGGRVRSRESGADGGDSEEVWPRALLQIWEHADAMKADKSLPLLNLPTSQESTVLS